MPGTNGSAIKTDPKEIIDLPPKSIDYDLTEIANSGFGARKVDERVIKKVRVDMGWSFNRKKKTGDDEEEEEAENPDMDLNCAFYDAKGEEIQVLVPGCVLADWVPCVGDILPFFDRVLRQNTEELMLCCLRSAGHQFWKSGG